MAREAAPGSRRRGRQEPAVLGARNVRTRRWYMYQLKREVPVQTAPLKLYLTEDSREAALAFSEKRKPGPFKGR